jgi:hypothetical protein
VDGLISAHKKPQPIKTGGLRVISINFDYFLQTKVRKVPGSGLGGIKVNPTLPLGISNLSVSEVSRVIGNV